jgi:hypothetical protein
LLGEEFWIPKATAHGVLLDAAVGEPPGAGCGLDLHAVLLVAIPGSVRILQLRRAAAGDRAHAGKASHPG